MPSQEVLFYFVLHDQKQRMVVPCIPSGQFLRKGIVFVLGNYSIRSLSTSDFVTTPTYVSFSCTTRSGNWRRSDAAADTFVLREMTGGESVMTSRAASNFIFASSFSTRHVSETSPMTF